MKKQQFDIEKLLKPFKKSGSEQHPIPLTLDIIFDSLANHLNFAPDIVARAVWKAFHEMAYDGKQFKGTNEYGSKSKELLQYLKALCWQMRSEEMKKKVHAEFEKAVLCVRIDCPKRTLTLEKVSRWKRFVRFLLKPRILWRI